MQLDKLDFGSIAAARRARQVSVSPETRERVRVFRRHVEHIAGVEEAVYRSPLSSSAGTGAAVASGSGSPSRRKTDSLPNTLETAEELANSGTLLRAVEEKVKLG